MIPPSDLKDTEELGVWPSSSKFCVAAPATTWTNSVGESVFTPKKPLLF